MIKDISMLHNKRVFATPGIAILVVILSVCFGSLFFIMCYLLVRRRRREALLLLQQENEDNKNAMEQQDSDHVIVILPDESIACGKIPGAEGSATQPPEIDHDSNNEDRSERLP